MSWHGGVEEERVMSSFRDDVSRRGCAQLHSVVCLKMTEQNQSLNSHCSIYQTHISADARYSTDGQ